MKEKCRVLWKNWVFLSLICWRNEIPQVSTKQLLFSWSFKFFFSICMSFLYVKSINPLSTIFVAIIFHVKKILIKSKNSDTFEYYKILKYFFTKCRCPLFEFVSCFLMTRFRLCIFGTVVIEVMLSTFHCILLGAHDFNVFYYWWCSLPSLG